LDKPQPSDHVSVAWTKAQPTISSYISALVPDFHASEDILQAVALLVVRKFDQYDPERPFLAWAIGIARNEVLHYRRSKAREKVVFNDELMELLACSFVEQEDTSKEIRRAMGVCLKGLTGKSKQIFRLRYGEDLAVNKIADQLKASVNSISATLFRCRAALRKCLSNRLGGGVWQS